ncbi:MAG: hypothetical protein SF182_20385 [Deltaproteobacteria bacterium]|nr:hypothetical protein [Deltaproteobacteria bacterium]
MILVNAGDSWRFEAWFGVDDYPLVLQPTAEERARRFARSADAIEFFRDRYRRVSQGAYHAADARDARLPVARPNTVRALLVVKR